jgi:hypothetical protein
VNNPGLPPPLWAVLDGKLWHATSPIALTGIIADRAIRVFRDRYTNALSKSYDAVSLMDFGPTATDKDQFINWVGWMGHQQKTRVAVWLEIDRKTVIANLFDAEAMLGLWSDAHHLRIIPGIEACHRGPISVSAISSVLLIDRYYDHARFVECPFALDLIEGPVADFERSLPPPPPAGFADALEAAIAKHASEQKSGNR